MRREQHAVVFGSFNNANLVIVSARRGPPASETEQHLSFNESEARRMGCEELC